MAEKTYKRLDSDQLIFLVQYLFTKLKNSSLADNTTYTLEKSGANVILKDDKGATISTLEDVGVTYDVATDKKSGLMSAEMVETLNSLKSFSEGGIATVKVNGASLEISNNSVNVVVPTKVTDLTDAANYAKSADLHAVATSGSYNDLKDTPTINTSTITIQKNGVKVDSFSVNQASNKSIDIAVPTKTSELENNSKFQTEEQVAAAIAAANHLEKSVVESLPPTTSAKANVIYMVSAASSTADNNVYDEYLLINGKFEKIGDTNLDLSGYVKSSELQTLTNDEITQIVDNAYKTTFTN